MRFHGVLLAIRIGSNRVSHIARCHWRAAQGLIEPGRHIRVLREVVGGRFGLEKFQLQSGAVYLKRSLIVL